MAKRVWLADLLNHEFLPEIARIKDTKKGRTEMATLAQSLRQAWADRGFTELKQQQGLMDQTRRALKDQLGEEHFCLEFFKFSTQEYVWLNDEKQRSVAERNEVVKPIEHPDEIVALAVRLLDSREWAEVAAGLAVLTGRRSSELLSTAKFELKTRWSVLFTGALKRRGEEQELSFEIPTLTTSDRVIRAVEMIRRELPEAQTLSPERVNAKYGQAVAEVCDRVFAGVVPARAGGNLYTHLFRAVYATIAAFWYCPPRVDPVEFRAAIQGHFGVLDAENPQLRRSLAASRHYADFEIADAVIAQYGGKRKGIKLGLAGVVPIEMFAKAIEEDPQSVESVELLRKHRSSLRIWREDHDQVAAILARFEGNTQQDRVSAWIEWSLKYLQGESHFPEISPSGEALGAIATTNDFVADEVEQIQSEEQREAIAQSAPAPELLPIQSTPLGSGLEAKLDKLVEGLAEFLQFQKQLAQGQAAPAKGSSRKLAPESTEEGRAISSSLPSIVSSVPRIASPVPSTDGEPKPRKYKTGVADAMVNQAIDAIMRHNDEPGQLHDLKWEITINGLKAFSTNQRVIERILEERREEIVEHHQNHQIQPGHNHRHKRKRKISEVISL